MNYHKYVKYVSIPGAEGKSVLFKKIVAGEEYFDRFIFKEVKNDKDKIDGTFEEFYRRTNALLRYALACDFGKSTFKLNTVELAVNVKFKNGKISKILVLPKWCCERQKNKTTESFYVKQCPQNLLKKTQHLIRFGWEVLAKKQKAEKYTMPGGVEVQQTTIRIKVPIADINDNARSINIT